MSNDSPSISASLLLRVQQGDNEGWRRFSFLFEPLILAWCRKLGVQERDSADLCQEVLRAVHGAVGKFERQDERSTFRGWLYRITQNKVRDHYRRQGERPGAAGGSTALQVLQQMPAEEEPSGDLFPPGEEQALLQRGLELVRVEFQEKSWQAFWLTTVEGKTAAEVAQGLGISPGAVYVAKSRVLARLKEELGDLLPAAGSEP